MSRQLYCHLPTTNTQCHSAASNNTTVIEMRIQRPKAIGAYSSWHWAQGAVHPEKGPVHRRAYIYRQQPHTLTFTFHLILHVFGLTRGCWWWRLHYSVLVKVKWNVAISEPWWWDTVWLGNVRNYALSVNPMLETIHKFAVISKLNNSRMLYHTEKQTGKQKGRVDLFKWEAGV